MSDILEFLKTQPPPSILPEKKPILTGGGPSRIMSESNIPKETQKTFIPMVTPPDETNLEIERIKGLFEIKKRALQLDEDPGEAFAKVDLARYYSERMGYDFQQAINQLPLIDKAYMGKFQSAKISLDRVKREYELYNKLYDLSKLYVKLGRGDRSDNVLNSINEIEKVVATYKDLEEKGPLVEQLMRGPLTQMPRWLRSSSTAIKTGAWFAAGAMATTAALGQTPPLTALPEEAITVPAAAIAGFKAGYEIGTLWDLQEFSAGLAYRELMSYQDEQGRKLNPIIMTVAAELSGVAEAFTEWLQLSTIFKGLKGVSGTVSNALVKFLGGGKFAKFAVLYGGTMAKETGQEVGQSLLGNFITELGIAASNAIEGTDIPQKTPEEIGKEFLDTLKTTPKVFALTILPGSIAGSFVETSISEKGRTVGKIERPIEETKITETIQSIEPSIKAEMKIAEEIETVTKEEEAVKVEVPVIEKVPVETMEAELPDIKSNKGIEADLWTKATKNIPTELWQDRIKSFSVESTGERGVSGKYENGHISLDGSDLRTLIHEISHAIELGEFGDRPSIAEARIALRDADLKTSPRDRVTNLFEHFWGEYETAEAKWLKENRLDLYQKIAIETKAGIIAEEVELPAEKVIEISKKESKIRKEYEKQTIEQLAQELTETEGTGKRVIRKAIAVGKKEGIGTTKVHQEEIKTRAKVRKEQSIRLKKVVKDLNDALAKTEKMSPQHAKSIRNLLENIDLVKRQKKTILDLSKTREFLANNPEAEMPDYILKKLELLDKKNLNDVTLEDLEDIHDAVMHHVHLENKKQFLRERGRDIKFHNALQTAMNELKDPGKLAKRTVGGQQFKGIKQIGRALRDTFGIRHNHYDLIIRKIAGANSMNERVFFDAVKEGIREQRRYRQNVFKQLQQDIEESNLGIKHLDKWLNEVVQIKDVKELSELTRGERIAVYLHSLNDDNRNSLIAGGIGFRHSDMPNKVYRITATELDQILNGMSEAEKKIAEPMRKLFKEQGKAIAKPFYELNGYELKLEHNYYPKDTMPVGRGGEASVDIEKEDALEQFKGKFVRVGLSKGMLKSRRGVKVPLYVNSVAWDINKSVMNSAAYIGLETPLKNASRLLYNRSFRAKMEDAYGPTLWKEIEQSLRDIAGEWKSYTSLEEVLLKMRNVLTKSLLGLNPFVTLKQVLSFPGAWIYVKADYLTQGLIDYALHPKEIKTRHLQYSPDFIDRLNKGYNREVSDVLKKIGAERMVFGGTKDITEAGMIPIQKFDEITVSPIMHGAVLQVLDEFQEGKLSREVKKALDMIDKDIPLDSDKQMELAYKFADYVVNRTQPTFSAEHLAPLQRGKPAEKLFTQFGSYTNQALNMIRHAIQDVKETGDAGAYAKLAKALITTVGVNTLGIYGIDRLSNWIYGKAFQLITGRQPEKKEPETIWEYMVYTVSGFIFMLKDLVRSIVSKIKRGTFAGYDMELPIFMMANTVGDTVANMWAALFNESFDKRSKAAGNAIYSTVQSALMSFGLPFIFIWREAGKIMLKELMGTSKKNPMGRRKK